jgi:mannose-6-phosphate isomerase
VGEGHDLRDSTHVRSDGAGARRFPPLRSTSVQPITGVVQHYAWGDPAFIPDLLGQPADGRPWAELWLGTHPNGPATLADGRPLRAVTGELPYLFKVLAVAEPLSLQTHPSRAQAEAGYAAGRYRDPQPKPELVCALTPFTAYCGVRPTEATLAMLDELGAVELAEVLAAGGPGAALEGLYRGRIHVEPIVRAATGSGRPEAVWVRELAARYPGDPSVAATLLLNLVELRPGEAIQLGPGNLHAYLSGAGIELMGASDNVVRGGLTVKAVDVDELLAVADPTPLADPVMAAAAELRLVDTSIGLVRADGPATHRATGHELVVTTTGSTGYLPPGDVLDVPAGTTAFIATAA